MDVDESQEPVDSHADNYDVWGTNKSIPDWIQIFPDIDCEGLVDNKGVVTGWVSAEEEANLKSNYKISQVSNCQALQWEIGVEKW